MSDHGKERNFDGMSRERLARAIRRTGPAMLDHDIVEESMPRVKIRSCAVHSRCMSPSTNVCSHAALSRRHDSNRVQACGRYRLEADSHG